MWWNASEYDDSVAFSCELHYNDAGLNQYHYIKKYGYPVRLVRD